MHFISFTRVSVMLVMALVLFEAGFARGISAQETPGKSKLPANRLAKESSPYLLLHAHNPVEWYPWGPEAFEKASRLSVFSRT